MESSITPLRAIEIMRNLTRQNVPFSFKYLSFSASDKRCDGIKEERNVFLAQGYRRNQSKKSEILTSFQRKNGERRQFYWPLLCELNGIPVKP